MQVDAPVLLMQLYKAHHPSQFAFVILSVLNLRRRVVLQITFRVLALNNSCLKMFIPCHFSQPIPFQIILKRTII